VLLQQEGDIDLLLTDMVMPKGMTGRQLAEAARMLRPGLPVLFMSGYTDDRVALESGSPDGLPLVRKPFTKKVLAEAVRAALTPRAA
jgi:CheY-like chemotaxis protein